MVLAVLACIGAFGCMVATPFIIVRMLGEVENKKVVYAAAVGFVIVEIAMLFYCYHLSFYPVEEITLFTYIKSIILYAPLVWGVSCGVVLILYHIVVIVIPAIFF